MLRKEERGEINDLKFLHIKWEKEGQSNPGVGGRGGSKKNKSRNQWNTKHRDNRGNWGS